MLSWLPIGISLLAFQPLKSAAVTRTNPKPKRRDAGWINPCLQWVQSGKIQNIRQSFMKDLCRIAVVKTPDLRVAANCCVIDDQVGKGNRRDIHRRGHYSIAVVREPA